MAFSIISCGAPGKPVDFKAGEFECSHCRMGITDMRFKGEAVTQKGKIYRFDSIECLTAWSMKNQEQPHSAWVTNFLKQEEWVDVDRAIFLHSKKLNSPMGAGLSAYSSEDGLNEALHMYGGEKLSRKELVALVAEWGNISSDTAAEYMNSVQNKK